MPSKTNPVEENKPEQQPGPAGSESKKDSPLSRPKPRLPYLSKPPAEGLTS